MPPTQGHFISIDQVLEGQLMLQSLSFQVRDHGLVAREDLIVLDVVHQAQGCIEGLQLQGSLLDAGPLPSGMDPFRIQDMVRGQKEARCQELKEALILPMAFLQKIRRLCLGEVLEVLPQVLLGEDAILERGSVCRPGGHDVSQQGNC